MKKSILIGAAVASILIPLFPQDKLSAAKIFLETKEKAGIEAALTWLAGLDAAKNDRYLYDEKEFLSIGKEMRSFGYVEEAARFFNKTASLIPQSSAIWETLGATYLRALHKDEAARCFQQALAVDPKNRGAQQQLKMIDALLEDTRDETREKMRFRPGENTGLQGPYLGQRPPGMKPELFAPGIVSVFGSNENTVTLSPDGRELYFGKESGIWVCRWTEKGWTAPQNTGWPGYEMWISPDSGKMYYTGYEPGIWVMEKEGMAWGKPQKLVSNGMFSTLTRDETLYTTVFSERGKANVGRYVKKDGKYETPEVLGPEVNSPNGFDAHPNVAPDGSLLLFDRQLPGGNRLFVSFRNPDGGWSPAQSLGDELKGSLSTFSPDGKYLFFMKNRDIFWVDAGIIEELKPKQLPSLEAGPRPVRALVLLGEWFGDAYFPLAKEIEARGWTMKRVGLDGEYRGCYNKKRDVALRSDIVIQDKMDLSGFDALIIPSGPQWRTFNENPTVLAFVRNAHAAGLIVASFCVGNTTVKAAGLVDVPYGPALFPEKVTLVRERVLLGPKGGGPPPGDGFESAPIKEICDAVARELAGRKAAVPVAGQIHDAVRAGDLAKVKALVAKDPKVVNEKDARGRTPLHFASGAGTAEIVKFLIANGADVKATDPDGFTPLHWAAYEGEADAAWALIAAGADPNARGGPGVDTLESAFYGRHPEAVEALLQGGLKVQTKGEDGRALLHRAASAGFLSLVEYLLKNGADAATNSDSGGTLLHSAAAGGLMAMVEKLVSGGANINAPDDLGQTPLHVAAAAGRREMVDHLLARGADMKAVCLNGRTLLHCAAAGGLVELMDRLIKQGYPVDSLDRYGRTPLFLAALGGSADGAELLLSRGANVMAREFWGESTPLHVATFSGNIRLLEILVKHGADINALNEEASTPLLYISQAGRAEVMDWLLERGARLDARNDFNETALSFPLVNGFQDLVERLWPRAEALKNADLLHKYPLHRAAYLGHARPAAFLLGKGLPLDLKDESGRTPFHRAAQGGNVELARMLLGKGAHVNAADAEGSPTLHLAVKKGRTDMVRFLLQNGADPKAKDGKGRNGLDLAVEYGYPDIGAILRKAGAEPTPSPEKTDVASLLAKPLRDGEAIVWHLGHCGFAVKTRSRLLIFDYWPREPAPENPSLANGFINPEEIRDQDVTVFVSHNHNDHFDPVILSWRPVVKNIAYVFGWNARKGERTVDLPAPRATKTLEGMEIFTVNCEQDDVPEVAYLVKVDGLSIYHSGDYLGPVDGFKADMDYLLNKAGAIDLAFVGRLRQAELLKSKVVFPIHAGGREYMYGAFARKAAAKKLPSRVVCPENKGDRYDYVRPASEPRRTDKTDKVAPAGPYLGQKPPGMTPEVFAQRSEPHD